jgi:cytoskeleton protein RodZ
MPQRRANLFNNELPEPDDIRQVGGGVGGLLRRRREEIQQDIDEVSRQLRIRSAYIRAIEEGKFQDLPGSAYAVGFVRAYADYLGLDGGSIVGDYRDELARRSRQNDLVWPSEGTESRFPGGTILVVCVLLGLAIYGGWFYATQSGSSGIKLINQVPAYIKNATGIGQTADATGNAAQTESPKTEAQAAPAPAPASNLPESQAPATTQADNAPAAQPATPQTPPPAVIVTPTPSATPNAVVLGQGSQATPLSPAAPTPPAAASQDATGAATLPPAAAAPSTSPTTDQTASADAVPAVAPAAKVVIRANRDSWIEIRDKDDNVVLQKVLRQGESFNVPDQKGLLMTTGNAGGIVIELEGKPLQSLGSLGVVKRGIKLDPTALTDGSAFQTDDNQ